MGFQKIWRNWNYQFLILLPILGTVIAWYNQAVFVFLHSLVNIFAGGRSNTKTFGFLIFWGIILLIGWIFDKTEIDKILTDRTIYKKITITTALGSLLLGYFINFGANLWFLKNLGLKISDFIIVVNNGEISATQLFHSHVLKGTIAYWLNKLEIYKYENIDAGHAYLGLIPNLLFIIITGLILIAGTSLILSWLQTRKQNLDKNSFLFNSLFAIISFSLIKNLIDGGLLNSETVISLIGLIFFFFQSRKIKVVALTIGGLYFCLVVAAWLNGFSSNQPSLIGALIGIAVHGFLLVNLFLLSNKKYQIAIRQKILFLILLMVMAIVPISRDLKIFQYRNIKINPTDGAVVGLVSPPTGQNWTIIEAINDLSIYRYMPTETTNIGSVIDQQKLLDNFYPVSVPWQTCFPKGKSKKYNLEVLSDKPLKLPLRNKMVIISEKERADVKLGLISTKINVLFDPCSPRILNILQESISKSGPANFFLINPQLDNE